MIQLLNLLTYSGFIEYNNTTSGIAFPLLYFNADSLITDFVYALLSNNNLASKALRYDTCYTRDHIVLPVTKHEPYLPLLPSCRTSLTFGR